jgi:type II secretory pathway pseudopilin PulG
MKVPASDRSFTLVEILAATGILSVLMAIMFGILQQTSRGWQAANRRVEASQVARLALDQIASDLENCVAVGQGGVPVPGMNNPANYAFGFVHANAPGMNDLPGMGAVNISRPNDTIFVVTPYPQSLCLGAGDLCEVGYIPAYNSARTNVGSMRPGRYYLLRHFPFSPTNPAGSGSFSDTIGFRPNNDFLRNPGRWEQTPAGTSQTNFLPIVDNCLKFNITFFYTNSNGVMFTNVPSWGRPTPQGGSVRWVGNPAGVEGLPLGAVIQMCLVDDRTGERIWRVRGNTALDLPEKEGIPTNWMAVREDLRRTLQESVLTLERRVYFKNRTNQ